MKKMMILMGLIGVVSLAACQNSVENQSGAPSDGTAGGTVIQMELDKNYDISDPFVNARLFCVSDDVDVLDAEGSFQMDGESGIVEIKDNQTNEVLWSKTWHNRVDNDTFPISLDQVQKSKEYAIWFTGTKIDYAAVTISFESDLVQERERPSK